MSHLRKDIAALDRLQGVVKGARVRYRLDGQTYEGTVLIVGIDEHLIRRDDGHDDLVPARAVETA